jgi:hypothetical protein
MLIGIAILLATTGLMHGAACQTLQDEDGRGPSPLKAGVASFDSPAEAPPSEPDSPPTTAPADITVGETKPPAVKLLDEIEHAADDLHSFTASILYEVEDALIGETQMRKGEVIYRLEPESGGRSVAILFDEFIQNRRKREQLSHYIFSDRWLVEIDHDQKLFIKREIAAPGEQFDPFKLGEGPIPLPVGQPADEVLKRFDVSLTDLPEDGPLRKLEAAKVDGLRLVPKPDTPLAEDFTRIDLFYDRRTRLPVGVNVIESNGDRKTARLDEMVRNPALSETQRAKLSIEPPDPKQWKIDIRPLGQG